MLRLSNCLPKNKLPIEVDDAPTHSSFKAQNQHLTSLAHNYKNELTKSFVQGLNDELKQLVTDKNEIS